ncbi:MAG: hypothetical protein ASARMPRED_009048 [Alectoria sarmentosa]|nr:MAG: hypothetical protein ASARMPRED_009048 [Alectoria sarmentosa]
MIYEKCLVVGIIFPYSVTDKIHLYTETAQENSSFDSLAVALLQVSKTIRNEAEPTLYRRNTVQLESAVFSRNFFKQSLNTPERKLWLKGVSMSLNHDDVTKADRRAVLNAEIVLAQDDMLFPEQVYPQRVLWDVKLHNAYKGYLGRTVWPQKASPLLDSD